MAWDAQLGRIVSAGLEMAGGDDLLLVLDPDGKGVRSMVQPRVGVFIRQPQRWVDSAMAHPDQGGMQEACRRHAGGLLGARLAAAGPKLCLLGRENAGVSMILQNLLTI